MINGSKLSVDVIKFINITIYINLLQVFIGKYASIYWQIKKIKFL